MGKPSKISHKTLPRVIVAIPAYNEEQFIAEVVRKSRRFADKVIVVDDGSTDDTAQTAEVAMASVIRHEVNRGAGEATKSCFEVAKTEGADILVTLDGDGQHDPVDIPQVIAPILAGKADLVIGSRFLVNHSSMPKYRWFGIKVITWLYNIGSNLRISDAQSCFRAYGEKALRSLYATERGFGFSIELLVQARKKGLVISEVPISCIYHKSSHSKNPVVHGLSVALKVFRYRLKYR